MKIININYKQKNIFLWIIYNISKKHRLASHTADKAMDIFDFLLFGVIHDPAFPDHIDLDLTGILQFVFDLGGDLPGDQHHLVVLDDLRLYDEACSSHWAIRSTSVSRSSTGKAA